MVRSLYKTTIVIWSDFDPSELELDDIGRDAISGESYCAKHEIELVDNPENDSDWLQTEFFDVESDDCNEDNEALPS